MKEVYMIRNIIDLGFWSSYQKGFKGYLYGDQYKSIEECVSVIELEIPLSEPCEIIKVYINY